MEGQIARLKVLKRQVYGQGNLDLLKSQFLHRVADGSVKNEAEPLFTSLNIREGHAASVSNMTTIH